jgi:methionyl-tRNA formyltransferase
VARTTLKGPFPSDLKLGVNGIQVVDNRVFGVCGDHQAVEILEWFPASN